MAYGSQIGRKNQVANLFALSYKPPGAGCLEAQQDHNENNEPGFYSLENGPSKRNPRLQAVLDWEVGILVLSVATYLLLSLVRLRT